jgi:hypothetical protein
MSEMFTLEQRQSAWCLLLAEHLNVQVCYVGRSQRRHLEYLFAPSAYRSLFAIEEGTGLASAEIVNMQIFVKTGKCGRCS